MRFDFDPRKSHRLRENPRRGIGFEEAQEIFGRPYYLDRSSEFPEQYRAVGWVGDRLFSLTFEVSEDDEGEFYHLVTLWKSSRYEEELLPKALESRKPLNADEIADMADRGEDISRFFTNTGKMMPPIQRVNVDFTATMLKELDDSARELNISRQAVIKSLLRQALDRQHMARRAR